MASVPEDRRIPLFITGSVVRRVLSSPKKMVSGYVDEGDVVADLGCGPGFFTFPMAELVGRGGKVYAVDFDSEAVESVARKAKDRNLDGVIETRVSSAAEIDFVPDGSVDFVFAHGLLCCMKDHSGALRQIGRVLRKEGIAYLSVTRFSRKKDPRSVTAEEWERTLAMFHVMKSGQGLFARWALVSKDGGWPELPASGGMGPACSCT